MKQIYWRPRNVSRLALAMISVISLGGLLLVEFQRVPVKQTHYDKKLAAATLASKCFEAIKEERLQLNHEIDLDNDPADTGLIGLAISSATSTHGRLQAKQMSIDPNYAAIMVEMLERAGVQPGDTVAYGCSGSFPAFNICLVAALETLHLKPIGISSAAASQWGANIPDLLWLDMERALFDQKLISFRSAAASLGGTEDRGLGMDADTIATLTEGIERNELPSINVFDEAETFARSIDRRMELYQKKAAGSRIKIYLNVGGGTTSVGKSLGKRLMKAGLNFSLPKEARDIDSVMTRFLSKGVPVVHLVRVDELAAKYGLDLNPERIQIPEVGEGKVFYRQEYNQWYAAGVLTAILVSLYMFVRSDWGFRLFQHSRQQKASSHPEPMI